MAPSLSDLYEVLTLPRISNLEVSERCVVSTNGVVSGSGESADQLHLAISCSSISTYVLTPSPKLVWSLSLSPFVVVKSMSDFENLDKGETRFAVGCFNTNLKKNFLRIIEKSSENKQKENIIDVDFDQEIVAMKFSKSGSLLYVLLQNGEVRSYELGQLQQSQDSKDSFKPLAKKCKILYSEFISDVKATKKDLNVIVNNNDGYLLTAKQDSNDKISLSLVFLANGDITELFSHVILKSKSKMTFTQSAGVFYVYTQSSKELAMFSITLGTKLKTISFKELLSSKKGTNGVRILSPAEDRVILSAGDDIYLVNTKFESLLSEYNGVSECHILNVNSVRKKNISLNLLSFDKAEKSFILHNLAVDVGNNSLIESMGKGFHKPKQQSSKFALEFLASDVDKYCEPVLDKAETKKIDTFVKDLKSEKDLKKFDSKFLQYIKKNITTETIDECYDNEDKLAKYVTKHLKNHTQNSKTFSVSFFLEIADILFEKNIFPTLTFMFLITNGYLASKHTLNGVLVKFSNDKKFLVALLNSKLQFSCKDLILLIFQIQDDEDLFKQSISLLRSSKSELEIVKELKTLLNSSNEGNFNEKLDNLIFKIIELDLDGDAYKFLNLLIDSIGILNFSFNNDEAKLNKLVKLSELKIAEILKLKPVESVLAELIDSYEEKQEQSTEYGVRTRSNSTGGPKIITVRNQKVDQKLNAILGFDSSNEKIPDYSIERLVNL